MRPFEMNFVMAAFTKLGWCMLVSVTFCARATGQGLHHYVFFNRDRERINDSAFLETKAFEGAQLKYSWRELERETDTYDFSDIERDLSFLQSKGKKLFIQLQDASFDPGIVNVPPYLLNDPRFNGGADKQYDIFLSHSHDDAELILGVKKLIEDLGLTVYVDWIEDAKLDRSKVTRQTGALLRARMRSCSSLIICALCKLIGLCLDAMGIGLLRWLQAAPSMDFFRSYRHPTRN